MKQELSVMKEDISGEITVKMANGQTLSDFCLQHIPEYNPDRFEAFAIRLFVARETVITVYALDKIRQEGTTFNPEKIPVKKFKINTLPLTDMLSYCESFNCTLTTGNYALEDMEVINK